MAASAELVREHAKGTIRLRFVEDPVKGGVDAERLKVDMEVLKTMFREYFKELNVILDFQDVEAEMAKLPGKYSPAKDGFILFAYVTRAGEEEEHIAGSVCLRRLADDENGERVGEVKRLYVRPAFRGMRLGQLLTKQLVRAAIRMGYDVLRLDTLRRLQAASRLYEALGFVECEAYYNK